MRERYARSVPLSSLVPWCRSSALWLARFITYGAVACASTWPLASRLTTHYPIGFERTATVPLASAWALWWHFDRMQHGFADYWQAPIFSPVHDAFALSEPMPLLGFISATWLSLGAPLVLAYNLTLLLCLALNGTVAHALLRSLRVSEPYAWVGGSMICTLPFVHHQLAVLTVVPLAGMLTVIALCLALERAPRWWHGIALGCAAAATYACCAQYALLLGMSLALAWLCALGRGAWQRQRVLALLIACVTALLLIAPELTAQRTAARTHHIARSERSVQMGSAALATYVRAAPSPMPMPPGISMTLGSRHALYPGLARVALACFAVFMALRRAPRDRAVGMLTGVALGSLLLSVSGRIELGPYNLHHALGSVVPGLQQVRSIWRAGALTQLAIGLLAAIGAQQLLEGRGHTARIISALVIVALLEVWPAHARLAPAPDSASYQPWADFMRANLEPDEPYCLLPFIEDASVDAFEPIARFMVLTALHGRPMVNGYSSYFSALHDAIRRSAPRFGTRATAKLLRSYGVRYVVTYVPNVTEASAADWRLMFSDAAAGVRVYRLPGT